MAQQEESRGGSGNLSRQLGLWGATVSGVGVIVGAGIYALIGASAGLAGGATWLAFAVGAGVAGLTGISYARMGRRIPRDSPEFQYTGVGLGPRIGFVAGWLMVWADIIAIAAIALGFGGYLNALLGVPPVISGVALIVVVSGFVWRGIRESVTLASIFTLLEVGGLLVVVAVGIPHWGDHSLWEMPRGFQGVWIAATLSFFAYLGFDEIGNLAEEMRHPTRDMPRAIAAAVALTATLYVLVAISAVSLVGWQALASSSAPLATAVSPALGTPGSDVLDVIALIATSSTVLLLLLAVSRSFYGMARAGALPARLGRVGERKTPWLSIFIVMVLSSIAMIPGDITLVAQTANFAVLTSFGLVNLSATQVLVKEGRSAHHSMGRIAVSVLPSVLGVASCVGLLIMTGVTAIGLGVALAVIGILLGGRYARRNSGVGSFL